MVLKGLVLDDIYLEECVMTLKGLTLDNFYFGNRWQS